MSATKLTVGIPTFNRSGWLRQTIESVLAQSFTGFRLIVSDNASEDDTPDVVRSYGDERIDYVRSESNVGVAGNLNRLVQLADTEFLVIVPDDDVLYPGHLVAAVELLERFETVGVTHSAFDWIDAQARVIRRVHPVVSRSSVRIDEGQRALEWLMVSAEALCFPSVAYRTKAIVNAGGFKEEEGPFRDRQLWMRIALDWDFGYIAEALVGQRTHANSITTNIAAQQGVASDGREHFLVYSQVDFERRMAFLDDAPLDSERTNRLRALATLQRLVDRAAGLPGGEVAADLANLVRSYPGIVLRRAFWRLMAAQLGGRRARQALGVVSTRHPRLGRVLERVG
jgi:glycosyltransferase involved in cell wall biosynthesis